MLQHATLTMPFSADCSCPEDVALVAALQRGEARAVEHVVQRYVPALYRFVYYRVGDATVAEDVVSEVLVRMLTKVGDYVQGTAPFQAWLYRIARNLIADQYRAAHRRPACSFEQWLADSPGAEPARLQVEIEALPDRAFLQVGLDALTGEQRQVILLHVVDGWELPEVARLLGRSVPSVKSLYYRGIQSLRRILGAQEASAPGQAA